MVSLEESRGEGMLITAGVMRRRAAMEIFYFILGLIALGLFAAVVLSTGVVVLIVAITGLVVSLARLSPKQVGKRAERPRGILREQHQT